MGPFWIAAVAGILLAATAAFYHAGTVEASLCSPLAMSGAMLAKEGDDWEYALVTATITDMLAGDDGLLQQHDPVSYRIDDIRYMPSARSEIQVTAGTFSVRHIMIPWVDVEEQNVTTWVGVGEQIVIPFNKYEPWGGWKTRCFGVYHPSVLEYVDWFADLRDGRVNDDDDDDDDDDYRLRPSELHHFLLSSYALQPTEPPMRIGYWDKVSVSRLVNITATEDNTLAYNPDYPVLGNRYVFDTVYDIYNADPQTVVNLSAWDTRDEIRNLAEGQIYFVYSYQTGIQYGDKREWVSIVPMERSYEFLRNVYSSTNMAWLNFYNTVIPSITALGKGIEESDALKGNIWATHTAHYYRHGDTYDESDTAEPKMRVTVYRMDQAILDEWKTLLQLYGLYDVEINYVLEKHVYSSFHEIPQYETWRDHLIPTVKIQLEAGIPIFEVLCDDTLHMVIVRDGTPACVTASEAQGMLADHTAIMQVRPTVVLNVSD